MAYHHFVGKGLNRSEKIQAWVVDQLLNSSIPDHKRESSVIWELKHSSGMIQITRLLAQKRGMDDNEQELAAVAAALHDIYVILEGSYEKHAILGAVLARKILGNTGQFNRPEVEKICNAIESHSNKHEYSKDKFVELIKDADCTDCFFYNDTIYDDKPSDIREHYYRRFVRIRKELGLQSKSEVEDKLLRLEGVK